MVHIGKRQGKERLSRGAKSGTMVLWRASRRSNSKLGKHLRMSRTATCSNFALTILANLGRVLGATTRYSWAGDPRINLQNKNGKAKPYQVKQAIAAIDRSKEK